MVELEELCISLGSKANVLASIRLKSALLLIYLQFRDVSLWTVLSRYDSASGQTRVIAAMTHKTTGLTSQADAGNIFPTLVSDS